MANPGDEKKPSKWARACEARMALGWSPPEHYFALALDEAIECGARRVMAELIEQRDAAREQRDDAVKERGDTEAQVERLKAELTESRAAYASQKERHTWLSDPDPAPTSTRVEPGSTLTVGARYRITEIAPWDKDPAHSAGDELGCDPIAYSCGGLLDPEWEACSYLGQDRGHWTAHTASSCTYVTGLELIAGPPSETKP